VPTRLPAVGVKESSLATVPRRPGPPNRSAVSRRARFWRAITKGVYKKKFVGYAPPVGAKPAIDLPPSAAAGSQSTSTMPRYGRAVSAGSPDAAFA
jgi:hypothetical protein